MTPSPSPRWPVRYKTFYDAYYQEILAAAVIERWQRIDLMTNLLVALTASGSAFSGLALWNTPAGKPLWGVFATTATLASIFHGVARVAVHLQQQGEARRDFSLLRGNLQNVLYKMTAEGDSAELENAFEALRSKFVDLTSKLEPDLASTPLLRRKVQADLDQLLQSLGI